MTNLCVSAFSPFELNLRVSSVLSAEFLFKKRAHMFHFQAACVLVANAPYVTAFALFIASAKATEYATSELEYT